MENLTGLDRIDFAEPVLSVLPLRLTGADGAPVRAVAPEPAARRPRAVTCRRDSDRPAGRGVQRTQAGLDAAAVVRAPASA